MVVKIHSNVGSNDNDVVAALGPSAAVVYLKLCFATLYLYYCTMYATKAAFLAFYYSLYWRFSQRMKITLHCVAGFTAVTFVVNVLVTSLLCRPLNRVWLARFLQIRRELDMEVHDL